jgi:hypothetical protein
MYASVRNLTDTQVPLHDAEGNVVYLKASDVTLVDEKFIDFQLPPVAKARVVKRGITKPEASTHAPRNAGLSEKDAGVLLGYAGKVVETKSAGTVAAVSPYVVEKAAIAAAESKTARSGGE